MRGGRGVLQQKSPLPARLRSPPSPASGRGEKNRGSEPYAIALLKRGRPARPSARSRASSTRPDLLRRGLQLARFNLDVSRGGVCPMRLETSTAAAVISVASCVAFWAVSRLSG